MWLGPEMRLLCAILLNAAVLIGAYLAARRCSPPGLRRLADTLLLTFTVQYAAVMVPGLLQLLCPISMSVFALLAAGGLGWLGLRGRLTGADESHPADLLDRRAEYAGGLFLVGCLGAWLCFWQYNPIAATDPLTYHVPAAVQWLREGRISVMPTWFFNPANTWSPLAGSAFIAWWIAPMHGDVLARFAQIPALLLVFAVVVRIARAMSAGTCSSILIGLTAVLCRPLLNEAMLAKDDVYLVAFFGSAVAACVGGSITTTRETRLNAARLGLAAGLMLATKYTALLSLPILLLLLPFKSIGGLKNGWIVVGLVFFIAGPWYLRNWASTGNPLFPVDVSVAGHTLWTGIFTARRSDTLRRFGALWDVATAGYFAVPVVLTIAILIGWGGGLLLGWRRLFSSPMVRVCLLGPVIGVGLFVWTAPYAEVRFIFPSLILLIAASAIALEWLARIGQRGQSKAAGARRFATSWLSVGAAAFLLILSLGTTHVARTEVAESVAAGVVVAIVGTLLWDWFDRTAAHDVGRAWRAVTVGAGAISLTLAGLVYVYGRAFTTDYEATTTPPDTQVRTVWDTNYREGLAWSFLRRELPADAVVAYANTHLIYPLMGGDFRHRVVYIPPRPDVSRYAQLPHLPGAVSGERLNAAITEVLNTGADRDTWLQRLRDSGAAYLFIVKTPVSNLTPTPPPELAFAKSAPGSFVVAYEDEDVVIYRLALKI